MRGARYPPAPARVGGANGNGRESAHMASDSDCFSNATVSTRSWIPPWTTPRAAAGGRARAPDTARGVDAEHGLPGGAERVGEVELGHHHALEHVGGLADHHRV